MYGINNEDWSWIATGLVIIAVVGFTRQSWPCFFLLLPWFLSVMDWIDKIQK